MVDGASQYSSQNYRGDDREFHDRGSRAPYEEAIELATTVKNERHIERGYSPS